MAKSNLIFRVTQVGVVALASRFNDSR